MRAGIALGSNVGDRMANLRQARDLIFALSGAPGAPLCSRVYETEPVGCEPGTMPFLNAAVEIGWSDSPAPESLLEQLRGIERTLGRPARYPKNAPRVIDLDLVYFGDVVLKTVVLTLPHPRLRERRFVLAPLADIRPGLILPGEKFSVAQLLARLPDEPRVVACDSSF